MKMIYCLPTDWSSVVSVSVSSGSNCSSRSSGDNNDDNDGGGVDRKRG